MLLDWTVLHQDGGLSHLYYVWSCYSFSVMVCLTMSFCYVYMDLPLFVLSKGIHN